MSSSRRVLLEKASNVTQGTQADTTCVINCHIDKFLVCVCTPAKGLGMGLSEARFKLWLRVNFAKDFGNKGGFAKDFGCGDNFAKDFGSGEGFAKDLVIWAGFCERFGDLGGILRIIKGGSFSKCGILRKMTFLKKLSLQKNW